MTSASVSTTASAARAPDLTFSTGMLDRHAQLACLAGMLGRCVWPACLTDVLGRGVWPARLTGMVAAMLSWRAGPGVHDRGYRPTL